MELKTGMLAISKAGHDQGSWYVVLKVEGEYAYLVNGTTKTVDHSKKKKLKHLQPVMKIPEYLQEKLQLPYISCCSMVFCQMLFSLLLEVSLIAVLQGLALTCFLFLHSTSWILPHFLFN